MQLTQLCERKVAQVKAKFNQLTDMVKSQIELKRLIKRNQKQEEGVRRAVGRKRGLKPMVEREKELVCKIPFLVVKYHPDKSLEYPIYH